MRLVVDEGLESDFFLVMLFVSKGMKRKVAMLATYTNILRSLRYERRSNVSESRWNPGDHSNLRR